tara:strand:+ start:201 stop:1181 length:981 start_codon:yes stop_codon:yes gene_type:complete
MNEKSKLFNYQILNDVSFCSKIKKINSKKLLNKIKVKNLKIISQNLLGLENPEFFTAKRIPYIIKNLKLINADIYLLQEVSKNILNNLKDSCDFKKYYFSTDIFEENEKQLQNIIISKIKPIEFKNFFIGGISNYYNSFSLIRFSNLIIVNLYVQSGNYNSPYLEKHWTTFQKCRIYNLKYIKKYIYKKYYSKCKNIIFSGDFNFDINENTLEKKVVISEFFNLKQNNYDMLLTEDTTKNFFRFNLKQKEKIKQYDGFFICGDILSYKPILINTKPIFYLNKKEENIFIYNLKKKFDTIKIKTIDNKIPIFMSDHFGVVCEFKIMT